MAFLLREEREEGEEGGEEGGEEEGGEEEGGEEEGGEEEGGEEEGGEEDEAVVVVGVTEEGSFAVSSEEEEEEEEEEDGCLFCFRTTPTSNKVVFCTFFCGFSAFSFFCPLNPSFSSSFLNTSFDTIPPVACLKRLVFEHEGKREEGKVI